MPCPMGDKSSSYINDSLALPSRQEDRPTWGQGGSTIFMESGLEWRQAPSLSANTEKVRQIEHIGLT
jgi:hypothetical protein